MVKGYLTHKVRLLSLHTHRRLFLKDQLMQKGNQVPSFPEKSETMTMVSPENGGITGIERERKNRKSAAMIGLAISMGASSVLLPGHNHQVMAATNASQVTPLTSVSETTEPFQEAEIPTKESLKLAPPEIKHKVKQGETIWHLSKNYEIAPEEIAASNKLKGKAPLLVGQTVNIPVIGAVTEVSQLPSDPSSANPSAPIVEQLPVGESLPVKDNVDQLLQQPRQGETPLIASHPNTNSSEAIAIQVIQPGNSTSNQFPKLIPQQHSAVPLNISSYSSTPSSRIEQPKIIQESGKPIPVPPPQVGLVPIARVPQVRENGNVISENNPSLIQRDDKENKVPRPFVIPVATPTADNSRQGEQMASSHLPQVTRQGSFSTIVSNSSNSPIDSQFYQVRTGDTLNSIARRYGISRAQLMQANRITNPNLIKVSQQLVIPSKTVMGSQYQSSNYGNRNGNLNVQPNSFGTNNSQVQPVNNVYLNNLRSEIGNLQQSPQNQLTNDRERVTIPVVSQFNNSQPATSPSINPEWQRSTVQMSSRQPSRQSYPQGNYNSTSFEQPQVIGAVPIPVEGYNPMLRPYNGQPVSPDSNFSPNPYSPDNTSPFTGYIWPAKGVLTSGYGWRWGRMHKGIDVAAPVGTPVLAAAAGEVITAGWNSGGYGNLVKVRHPDGSVTLYGHNSRILVRQGQFVEQGQQIANMGSTGFSTGPHLHFEIHPYGKGATNPIAFLPPRTK